DGFLELGPGALDPAPVEDGGRAAALHPLARRDGFLLERDQGDEDAQVGPMLLSVERPRLGGPRGQDAEAAEDRSRRGDRADARESGYLGRRKALFFFEDRLPRSGA